MKAILEFDLDNPEDLLAYERCNRSLEMAIFMFEFLLNKRKKFQHIADISENISAVEMVELIFDDMWAEAEDNGIDVDKLIN